MYCNFRAAFFDQKSPFHAVSKSKRGAKPRTLQTHTGQSRVKYRIYKQPSGCSTAQLISSALRQFLSPVNYSVVRILSANGSSCLPVIAKRPNVMFCTPLNITNKIKPIHEHRKPFCSHLVVGEGLR